MYIDSDTSILCCYYIFNINISTISGERALQSNKQPGYSAKHRNMLQFSDQVRYTKDFHKFRRLHQQWTCCDNQWEAGWPNRNQKSVSYLATRQHGNVKLMPSIARHIPGPDARQRCNSSSATSPHSANQSSLAFSPPLRVTTFTFFSFLAPPQKNIQATESEKDAMLRMGE